MRLSIFALLAGLSLAGVAVGAQARAPASPHVSISRFRIATHAARPIGPGCVYRASVRGTLQARDDVDHVERVRNADLHTRAAIACNGHVVSRREEHLVVPVSTVERLNSRVEKGLRVMQPGEPCLYSNGIRLARGRVAFDRALTVCKVMPTSIRRRAEDRNAGPRPDALSNDARFGAH